MKAGAPWVIAVLVLAGLGIVLLRCEHKSVRRFAFVDFYDYYFAADAVSRGANPYDPALADARAHAAGAPTIEESNYIYPPWFAAVLVPLAVPSPSGAAMCWYVASALALLLALALLPTTRTRPWELVAAVLFPGTLVALFVGQVNPIVLVLIVGGWRWRDERPAISGGLLGLAVAIKLSPLLLVLASAGWRRWRVVVASVSVVAVCLVVGELAAPGATATYFDSVLPAASKLTPALAHPGNQGFGGAFLRALSPNPWTTPFVAATSAVTPATHLMVALMLGVLVWHFVGRRVAADELRCWAAVVTVMVIGSPRAWEASYILLLFPLSVVRDARPHVAVECWVLVAIQRAFDGFAQNPSGYHWLQVASPLSSLGLCSGIVLLVALLRSDGR